jgi:hypothetical protein
LWIACRGITLLELTIVDVAAAARTIVKFVPWTFVLMERDGGRLEMNAVLALNQPQSHTV